MTDNSKRFFEEISDDKEFMEKLAKAPDKEAVIVLAKEKGFTLTEEDFEAYAGIQEVSDDELEAVAGGYECYCVAGGGGKADDKKGETACACVMVGFGLRAGNGRCSCLAAGYGSTAECSGGWIYE